MTSPSQAPQNDDTFVLDSIDALKAVSDPLRLQMLRKMKDRPWTVKELAASFGVPQTRLYYHVKLLERHGIIRVASRRMVSGIEERSYEASARSTTVSPALTAEIAPSGALRAMFEMVAAELELALAADNLTIGEEGSSVRALALTSLYITEEQLAEVQRRLESIMADFGKDERGPDDLEFSALLTLYERVDAS